MAKYALPNGSTVSIAKTMAAALPFTAATNASQCVLTVTGATVKANDVVLIESAWLGLNNLVARVSQATATAITLENVDTSDTTEFPVGGGTGTIKVISAWQQIPLITNVATAGGEQQSTAVQFLEWNNQVELDTFKTAVTQTYTMAHDAFDQVRPLLEGLDKTKAIVPVYFFQKRLGEQRYYAATVAFQKVPATAMNEVETVQVILRLQSEMKIYAVKP
ncbi:putative major tail protein [Serratia phage vB_SmaM-ChibiTotoro]|nr:putative major tail protein [Serratia phage vB_SmaM-ChibiTotoro]